MRGPEVADVEVQQAAADAASVAERLAETRVIVASNRQPYSHGYDDEGTVTVDRPVGGLTAGLDPVMQELDGAWIAWGDGEADGTVVDENDCVRVPPEDPAYTLHRIWLSEGDREAYYLGYSNQVLWPLCHSLSGMIAREPGYWERYRDVNRRFADAIVDELGGDDLVWFQDYHLALAPRFVREAAAGDPILTQFWHIPWPDWETFRTCPDAEALLDGLLANDALGMHVPRYRENFLACVEATFPDADVDPDDGMVVRDGHVTHVGAFPMGVDAETIDRNARSAEATAFWRRFADEHGLADRRVALGVDRLDYTKGIPERLEALEHLFETRPEWRGRLTYVGKESESRSSIPAYQQLQDEVDEVAARINDRFGTEDWQPVVRIDDHLSPEALAGLYRYADVCLVTALRDGMNLVAKEYVAAQADRDGVLVLSELTGFADEVAELDGGALTVNPYDREELADAIDRALRMGDLERVRRLLPLRKRVFESDLSAWMRDVLAAAQGRVWEEEPLEPEVVRSV